jgi:AraC family transcriptional regulator
VRPLDRVVFASATVRVGAFRCGVDDARFRNSGPTEGNLVVFPRRGVWIRQAGSRPIVADHRLATVYNLGREYDRAPISPDGDRCEWFALAPRVAVTLARELDPGASDDPTRTYRAESATVEPALYHRQRRLFLRLERGALEPLAAEEQVLAVAEAVLRRGLEEAGRGAAAPRLRSAARRDLVERAREDLARNLAQPTDLARLSARLETSPSHLCRVFRQGTGLTLHQYRLDLRLRAALESLESPRLGFSRIAAELGFSSHSHFTAALRRRHGITPGRCREVLQGM